MIIHSIVPPELIFRDSEVSPLRPVMVEYMGEMVEAVPNGKSGGLMIIRVLSTSPTAYLKSELQPGREIRFF